MKSNQLSLEEVKAESIQSTMKHQGTINALAIDTQGNVWSGASDLLSRSSGGLVKFDGENWTVHNTANSGMPGNWVTCLAIDAQGNVWSGIFSAGLVKFDGENWTVYNRANSGLSNSIVWGLTVDIAGNVWTATQIGLSKFDGSKWTQYFESGCPLPDNLVYSVVIDAQGNKWIGTQTGGLAAHNEGGVIFLFVPDTPPTAVAPFSKYLSLRLA